MLNYSEILDNLDKIRTAASGKDAMLHYLLGMLIRHAEEKEDASKTRGKLFAS